MPAIPTYCDKVLVVAPSVELNCIKPAPKQLATPNIRKKPVVLIIVVLALLTLKAVAELKLMALCKSSLNPDPSALSVRSMIGITIVDAEKSIPAPLPPCDGNNWLILSSMACEFIVNSCAIYPPMKTATSTVLVAAVPLVNVITGLFLTAPCVTISFMA